MKLFEEYLSRKEKENIQDAIEKAESLTSGEIRVFFEQHCKNSDPYERGLECFASLNIIFKVGWNLPFSRSDI